MIYRDQVHASCVGLILLAILVSPEPAAAQSDPSSVLRSVSRMQAVRDVCPAYIQTDRARADAYTSAFRDVAVKMLGPNAFSTAMGRELGRRRSEISTATAAAWCEGQRASLRDLGINDIFAP